MQPNPHTLLVNYVIGLCRKEVSWPSCLNDLGYDPQIIEQSLSMKSGDRVKPDVVVVSNKLLHGLVVDCKGGNNANDDQITRYRQLVPDDLRNYVTVYDRKKLGIDVCFTRFENQNSQLVRDTDPFPILTFNNSRIEKTRDFKCEPLDKTFEHPISLEGCYPPLGYYPFSEIDEDTVIIPRVLRALVQVALRTSRGGSSALDEAVFTSDEILVSVHHYWSILALEHRNRLRARIQSIFRMLLSSDPDLRNALSEVESKKGYKITTTLQQLQKIAQSICEKYETQKTMDQFPHQSR